MMLLSPGLVKALMIAVICVAISLVLAKVNSYLPEIKQGAVVKPESRLHSSLPISAQKSLQFNSERLYLDDQRDMFWLDDHRILYSSYRTEELQQIRAGGLTPEEQYQSPRVIRIFDSKSGDIIDHALMAQGLFCFSKGNILYQKWAEPRSHRVLLWGAIGQEREDEEVTRSLINGGFNAPIRCSGDKAFEYKYPNRLIALLEEHGVVEVRNSGKGQEGELWLHGPSSSSPIRINGYMPVDAHNLENNAHTFHPWKGAYFITRTGRPYEAWWLFPDGTTERIQIPKGPWDLISNPRDVGFEPTRVGLLVTTGCSVGLSCHKWYLLKGDMGSPNPKFHGYKQIDVKLSFRNAISPDGCKLATTHGATGLGMKIPPKIKTLELCGL